MYSTLFTAGKDFRTCNTTTAKRSSGIACLHVKSQCMHTLLNNEFHPLTPAAWAIKPPQATMACPKCAFCAQTVRFPVYRTATAFFCFRMVLVLMMTCRRPPPKNDAVLGKRGWFRTSAIRWLSGCCQGFVLSVGLTSWPNVVGTSFVWV